MSAGNPSTTMLACMPARAADRPAAASLAGRPDGERDFTAPPAEPRETAPRAWRRRPPDRIVRGNCWLMNSPVDSSLKKYKPATKPIGPLLSDSACSSCVKVLAAVFWSSNADRRRREIGVLRTRGFEVGIAGDRLEAHRAGACVMSAEKLWSFRSSDGRNSLSMRQALSARYSGMPRSTALATALVPVPAAAPCVRVQAHLGAWDTLSLPVGCRMQFVNTGSAEATALLVVQG